MNRRAARALLLYAMIVGIMAGVAGAQTPPPQAKPAEGDLAYPPDAIVSGLSLPEWLARNGQWSNSLPVASSPLNDPTGERCAFGQSGPVFFLAGSGAATGRLACTVPPDTALLLTVLGGECSTAEPPPFFGSNEAELTACATALFDQPTSVQVTVNTEYVADVRDYRVTSPLHYLILPEDNWLRVPAGVVASVASGYYVILKPLPVGTHVVSFRGSLPAVGAANTATYEITVAAEDIATPVD